MSWYIGLFLTALAFIGTMYSKWRRGQQALSDVAYQKEQAKIEALKASLDKTQKEADNAGKDYNTVYDAYKRKYDVSKRDAPK